MIAIELGCKKQVKRALHRAPFLYETTVLLQKSTGLTYATADPAWKDEHLNFSFRAHSRN